MAGCSETNSPLEAKTEENLNSDSQIVQTIDNNASCPVTESRNWQASIDRTSEEGLRLNVSGEVDMPTPGYRVEWQAGILDRRQPPAQRLALLLTPPEGMAIQVITPTKVNFTMPTTISEYRSLAIYCGDKLLAEIPNVTPQENATLPIEVSTFTADELFDAGGGGCGMSLSAVDTNPRETGFLFFNGIGDSDAFMSFDGKITKLNKKSSQGEEFYAQKTKQTFTTEDAKIAVEVNVNLGAKGEIESVNIPSGTITVITEGQTKQFSVTGDAGC